MFAGGQAEADRLGLGVVVGFDNLPRSDVAPLALTSIDQQPRELGRLAVRLATERMDEPGLAPRREVLAPRLVVRRSSGG